MYYFFTVFQFSCKKDLKNFSEPVLLTLSPNYLEGTPFKSVSQKDLNSNEVDEILMSARKNGYMISDLDKNNIWELTTKSNLFKVYIFGLKNAIISTETEEIPFVCIIRNLKTGQNEISRNLIKNFIYNGKIVTHEYYKYNMFSELTAGAFIRNGKVADEYYIQQRVSGHNCYMSYSICVNAVYSAYTSDNLGATLAEWLPVRTMSNVSCAILRQEGYIYGGPGFDFSNCNTIYLQ